MENKKQKKMDIRVVIYRYDEAQYGRNNEERYEGDKFETIEALVKYLQDLKDFFELKDKQN